MADKTLERVIEWTPAFDRRDPDPNKNYGIHGLEMRWYLKGPAGAVQFILFTGWMLPHVRREHKALGAETRATLNTPMAADLGYHSPLPRYEGQTAHRTTCPLLPGGVCYYDGSSLNADPIFDIFVSQGEEATWQALAAYYDDVFGKQLDEVMQ